MNRILFEQDEIRDGMAAFGGERAAHVLAVLHGTVGQTLKTGVVDGLAGTSEIVCIDGLPPGYAAADPEHVPATARIVVRCDHRERTLPPWIDLVLAPPRPRALKRLLPQLASLGVGTIHLVGAEKVEKAFWGAQLLREEVHRPLLVEGLMQAGTTALPRIEVHRSFRRWMADAAFGTSRFVAHPYGAARPATPCAQPADVSAPRPVLAVGPEGGWTDEEVASLEALSFTRLSLGPRILRTDVAVVALLARLMPT